MNKNLVKLFNALVNQPELLKQFNDQDNLEDLYKLSTSISDGYSMDEFKEFLENIVANCSAQNNVKKVSIDELEYVAGGSNLLGSQKLQSLLLSGALMALGSASAQGLSTSNYNNSISVSQSKSFSNVESKYDLSNNNKNNNLLLKNENASAVDKNTNNDNVSNADSSNENVVGKNVSNSKVNNSNDNSNAKKNVNNNNNKNDTAKNSNDNVRHSSNKNVDSSNENAVGKNDVTNSNGKSDNNADHGKNSNSDRNNNQKHDSFEDTVIILEPKATSITYGQKLSDSRLFSGMANVPGKFEWVTPYTEPSAGKHTFMVRFVPNDNNLTVKTVAIQVRVEKAKPNIIKKPESINITYGHNLKESRLVSGKANISGTFSWKDGNKFLNAGLHDEEVIFTPSDTKNYEQIVLRVRVQVDKAIPRLEKNNFTRKYKPNCTLSDISLPKGWKWKKPYVHLDSIGRFEVEAVYNETSNYSYRSETVFVEVTKADPIVPSFNIVYNPYSTLRDVQLPNGWHWSNPNEIPEVSKQTYKASFDARDAGTPFYYSKSSVDIPIAVHRATPKVLNWAQQASEIVYGTNLSSAPMVGGFADVPGTFRFADTSSKLPAGQHVCKVIFTPFDSNYESVEGFVTVQISKNMTPSNPPVFNEREIIRKDTSIDLSNLSEGGEVEFSKDGGMTWQSSPVFSNLSPNSDYYLVGRYKETNSRCAGYTSNALRVSTKYSSPDAPDAPILKSRTNKKIVLKSNEKLEFSIDGGKTWQSSPEFTGLRRKTRYNVIARFKETDNFMPSKNSECTSIVTNRFPRLLSWLFG